MFALVLAAALAASPTQDGPKRPRVYVGVYLSDVSNFDLKAGRFDADLFVWAKWDGGPDAPPLTYLNGQIENHDEVAREEDGTWRTVRWRVQGTFRGTFPLQAFPFDVQTLPIEISLADGNRDLVPDLAGSGMTSQFSITGWIYEPYFRAHDEPRSFASDFGSVVSEGRPQKLETVTFLVEMRRPLAAYSIKFMAPLLIILAMAFLAFFVPPPDLEVRASLGVTALLSCVAFHFTQADSLPEVAYLVTADKLFIGAYAVVFCTLALSLISYALSDEHAVTARKLDVRSRILLPVLTLVGALSVILSAPRTTVAIASAQMPVTAAQSPAPSRTELRAGVASLTALNSHSFHALLRRGMSSTDSTGERHGHLATVVPAMTNDRVRFLPDGGMSVRWELREDARFSDGTRITSEDLAFGVALREDAARAQITVVDERTIDVRYTRRVPSALNDFMVLPKAIVEPVFKKGGMDAVNELLRTTPPPGDGPYVLEKFEANKEAVFTRNPHFLGPPPRLERIVVRPYESSVGLAVALKADTIDLAQSISVSGLELLVGQDPIATRITPVDNFHFLQPDLHRKPFDDVRVRQALLYAVDREGLAQDLFGPGGAVADSYRPSTADDYWQQAPRVTRDVTKAKALLAEAGLPSPYMIKLFSPDAPVGSPHMKGMARLKANLEEAGFGVELEIVKKGATAVFNEGKHGGVMFYLRRDTAAADRVWNLPYENGKTLSDEPSALFDAEAVALVARYKATLFEERREVLSRELQKKWIANLPLIPLLFGPDQSAWRTSLEGFDPGESDTVWWNVETWRLAPQSVEGEAPAPAPAPATSK